MAEKAVKDGSALKRLCGMIKAQGGNEELILDTDKFKKAAFERELISDKDGYITFMNTEQCGIASSMLGAGRETKESAIDYAAGIILHKKTGDAVKKGEVIAKLYAEREELFERAKETLKAAVTIEAEPAGNEPLIYERVTKDGVERKAKK